MSTNRGLDAGPAVFDELHLWLDIDPLGSRRVDRLPSPLDRLAELGLTPPTPFRPELFRREWLP